MLFMTYWELNENMPDSERNAAAQKLTSAGLFPPEGVRIIRWDGTPDNWGILIFEAESVEDVMRTMDMWRAAGAGFFKVTRTSPAMPVQDIIPLGAEINEAIASA